MAHHLIDSAFDIAEEEVEADESSRTLLRERTLIRSSHGENQLTQITNDLTAVNHLLLIEKLVPRLLQDDKDLFAVDALRGQPGLKGTDRYLSAYLYQCIRQSDEILAEHFPNHCYHPWVSLYLQKKESLAIHLRRAVMETNSQRCNDAEKIEKEQGSNVLLYLILSGEIPHHIGLGVHEICDSLNAFVRDIRISARSADFLKRLRSHRYAIEKNKRSLECYIDNLFEQHSRILVIRVDLGYGKDVSLEPSKTAHTTSEDARRHRDRLLKNIPSNSLFSGLVGYIWKLEYGLEKGYHYHWLFFFDGRTRCHDVLIAKQIGEYWKRIAGDTSIYWNCNANKHGYPNSGIGMINRRDEVLRSNLLQAAAYLTKPDLHLRLVDGPSGRTFGRGEIKKGKESDDDLQGHVPKHDPQAQPPLTPYPAIPPLSPYPLYPPLRPYPVVPTNFQGQTDVELRSHGQPLSWGDTALGHVGAPMIVDPALVGDVIMDLRDPPHWF